MTKIFALGMVLLFVGWVLQMFVSERTVQVPAPQVHGVPLSQEECSFPPPEAPAPCEVPPPAQTPKPT